MLKKLLDYKERKRTQKSRERERKRVLIFIKNFVRIIKYLGWK